MKKIGLWFWLLTKRQLKSVFFLMILILIPLSSWTASRMGDLSGEQNNRAALYARDDDEIAAGTIEDLLASVDCYEFYLCDSEDELYEQVRTGKAECGYILNEGISQRIEKGKYKECIIVVSKTDSLLTDIINETVFSSFFKGFAKKIAMDYVSSDEKFALMDPEGFAQLSGTYDQYMNGNGTFKVEFEMLGDGNSFAQTKVIETKETTFPLRNVMAVLIMAGGMLGVLNWLTDREKGVFAPMRYDFIRISRLLYVFIPSALLGISTILSMAACGENVSFVHEIAAMLFYLVILTVFGTLCCIFMRKSYTIVSMMPVIIIGSLLVCPVFIDLSVYLPVIGIFRKIFVPYYYMMLF